MIGLGELSGPRRRSHSGIKNGSDWFCFERIIFLGFVIACILAGVCLHNNAPFGVRDEILLTQLIGEVSWWFRRQVEGVFGIVKACEVI